MSTQPNRAEQLGEFFARVFSGRDLVQFMEDVGVGVGATEHIVHDAERKHEKHPTTYRQLDGVLIEARLSAGSNLAANVKSFLESLPYLAPEQLEFHVNERLRQPLEDYNAATAPE